jgi:hypothetical protein
MTDEIMHARLVPSTSLANTPQAKAAAEVADAGGSPRAQIDAAREVHKQLGNKGSVLYTSHQGKRQRERAVARIAKQNGNG